MYLSTTKNWLYFWQSFVSGSGSRNFYSILQHFEIWHFHTIWLISLENWSGIHKFFDVDISLDKTVRTKFWNPFGSGPELVLALVERGLRSSKGVVNDVQRMFVLTVGITVLLLFYGDCADVYLTFTALQRRTMSMNSDSLPDRDWSL